MSETETSTAAALQEWRNAERSVAVAKRGRIAAEAAADAAQHAAEAADATAAAAKAALEAAVLAEASASKTATAAKMLVDVRRAEVAEAETGEAMASVDEAEAQEVYRDASRRALKRNGDPEETQPRPSAP